MPRYVDHDKRRRDIIEATNRVVADEGLRGLTFRAVAERLGGSTTLVTHYYSSQEELLTALATSMLEVWDSEIDELEANSEDPRERLMILLEWLVPITKWGRVQERARINLLAEQILGAETRFMFDAWEDRIRQMLREHLRGLVPKRELEMRVDSLRVLTNGLTLSVVEHPDRWPPRHVLKVLHQSVGEMGLLPESRTNGRPKERSATLRERAVGRR